MDIGIIGLGQMGREMAARLIDSGHALTVYNRTAAATQRFRGRARIASSAAEAAGAEVVITMLADDAAVESVWLRQKLIPRGIHVNMATVSLALTRELARAHHQYVAAPVFGRPAAAAKGELDIIAAGPKAAVERCRPLFEALARQVFVAGETPEQAAAVKIARNFLLATVIESLGEAFALVGKAHVSPETFLHILTSTSLAAPVYKSYGRQMVEGAYEPAQFSMELGLKDLELALSAAREKGVVMPTAELIRKNLLDAIAQGNGRKDWTALAEYLGSKGSG
ncbi:MAG: NAD(P)-dependent oxidoreductase [Betaproteobacteria bacterium]|nr:MAG: NAD(P)-dependent oxidoreductase [Betaproteobacteria bacterium]